MRPRTPLARVLLATLPLLACHATTGDSAPGAEAPEVQASSSEESAHGDPAAGAAQASEALQSSASSPAAQSPQAGGWRPDFRAEMSGAPYPRETSETLAALVPREPSGDESDERARRAFATLAPEEQADLIAWFTSECGRYGIFQETLIRYVVDSAERDADSWPDLKALEWYDPEVHCPAQPIPRVPLAADFAEVQSVRARILSAAGWRRLDSGWMVDYGARTLVRLPHQRDARRVFENGLLGMAPDWDLAEALVELALDDGSLQKSFQAFDHAYTDRWGGVYPGITLYDAHVAGAQMPIEMPDVDTLGLVHDLLGDWETWTAPVHPDKQADLYAKIAELFRDVSRHRGLRQNLARTYLCGSADLRERYANNLDNFHALWESCGSDPATLRERLPTPDGWADFLQGWNDSLVADLTVYYRGLDRHTTLERNRTAIRGILLRLLGEYGALDRIDTMPAYDQ